MLRAAYSIPDQDFSIDLNGTQSVVSIISGNTIGGVRVTVPPSLPDNRNAAHHSHLPFRIEIEATLPISGHIINTSPNFQETVTSQVVDQGEH